MTYVLCEHCPAACCRYLALEIDEPTSERDYDDIRWYLMHEGISVFVEDGDWYLQIQTRCKNIGADNLCQVYETRPEICREYNYGDCDYSEGGHNYELHFTHASQFEEHYEKETGRRLGEPSPPARKKAGSGKTRRPKARGKRSGKAAAR